MNDEEKAREAKVQDIMNAQATFAGGWVFLPSSCKCYRCGYDFADDMYPKALTELITGCPSCHTSYCE